MGIIKIINMILAFVCSSIFIVSIIIISFGTYTTLLHNIATYSLGLTILNIAMGSCLN